MTKIPRRTEYSFIRPVSIPDDFGPGSVASASGTVQLPLTVAWSGQGPYDLDDPQGRSRAYELVLAEGTENDVRTYVNWYFLLDAWQDMHVAPHVVDAWSRWMRSTKPDTPRYNGSRRFAEALRGDGLSIVAHLPPGAVDPIAVERCRDIGAKGLAISPISYWRFDDRDPEANDSLDGVWEATRFGLPILRTGIVDSVVDAQLTRRIALQSTLVSLDRVAPTRALEILETAWGEGTGIALEVSNEDQIDIAAAIGASVVVVGGDDLDNAFRLASDVAELAGSIVTVASVPATVDARARVGHVADAGYDAALVEFAAGEDPLTFLEMLAGHVA